METNEFRIMNLGIVKSRTDQSNHKKVTPKCVPQLYDERARRF